MPKNRLKTIAGIVIIIFILFSLFNTLSKKEAPEKNKPSNNEVVNNQYFFLNSILTLNINDDDVDKEKISSQIKAKVQELENKFTLSSPDSEVSKINENAAIKPVKVSDDTFFVIKSSLKYSELSDGKFDITVGDLVKLWAIDTENEKVPTDEQIKSSLSKIDYRKIVLDESKKTVFLKDKSMVIDLGAIAKGYVADVIKDILVQNDVKSAIVNLGGNVYAHGSKNGKDFKVGIRDPFSQDMNKYLGIYKAQDSTIVTSGVYERFFEKDGKRYHHILSTKTGYPVDNELVAVVIITKNSMQADALSTTAFAMGLQDGMFLIEELKDVEAIFITNDKQIFKTSGVKEQFELKDEIYIMGN